MGNRLQKKLSVRSGQAMLMTVLVLSGTILGATTIAGLLTLYQLRQSADVANSAKAIFASDAGIEWRLYKFFKLDGQTCMDCPDGVGCPQPEMTNQSSFISSCTVSPEGDITIKSSGEANKTSRALRIDLILEK